nr:MAG TPA: hypothetical protein [Caudoviricetes sp.]
MYQYHIVNQYHQFVSLCINESSHCIVTISDNDPYYTTCVIYQ